MAGYDPYPRQPGGLLAGGFIANSKDVNNSPYEARPEHLLGARAPFRPTVVANPRVTTTNCAARRARTGDATPGHHLHKT